MKCPIRVETEYLDKDSITHVNADCLKEECAWWHKGFEVCQVVYLTVTLNTIGSLIEDLIDKMPHEEQFRK